MTRLAYLFSVFFNLWIYRIFSHSFFLGILVLVCTTLLYLFLRNKKKGILFLYIFCTILLLASQVKTTQKTSLTSISNDDRRVIDMRLKSYPPRLLRIGHWLEERKESIALSRITSNLFENIDPNLYFFANHPRERVGIVEFEKFFYMLLPFLVIGILGFVKKGNVLIWATLLVVPSLVLSIIGNKNPLGPFALFPLLTVGISEGLSSVCYWLKRKL